jgi:hypothetical protein
VAGIEVIARPVIDVLRLALSATERVLEEALSVVRAGERVLGSERSATADFPSEWEPGREPPQRPRPTPRSRRGPRAPERAQRVAAPQPPAHVDEGLTLAAEFAEPGAEEGAGPEIEITEPWEGYDRLTAAEVRQALKGASPAAAAAVRLYEQQHSRRRSVIEAAERVQPG